MRLNTWKSQIRFISRSFSLHGSKTPFCCWQGSLVSPISLESVYRFGQGEKREERIPLREISLSLTDGSPQVAKLSASDIRPSVHLPYVLVRARSAEGGCAERNLCRAGSVAAPPPSPGSRALISVHPAPLLGGGRRAPSTHASRLESRFRGGYFPRVIPQDPRAPTTLPTRPTREVDNPARKLGLLLSTLHLLRKSQRTLSIASVRKSTYRNSKIQFSFVLQDFRRK
jgi:hypothetical protein